MHAMNAMNIPGLLDIIAYPHTALPSTGCRPWGRMAHWELWLDATVQALKGGLSVPFMGTWGKNPKFAVCFSSDCLLL